MKKFILFLSATFIFTATQSQIVIEKYERQLKCNVNNTLDLKKVVASSRCGDVTVKVTETMFSGGCLGTLVRTYSFTDKCGGKEVAEQYILLSDTEAPVLVDVPKDTTCLDQNHLPIMPEIIAEDNSGAKNIKVIVSEQIKQDRVIRIWTTFDSCGNTSSARQVIVFENY